MTTTSQLQFKPIHGTQMFHPVLKSTKCRMINLQSDITQVNQVLTIEQKHALGFRRIGFST